MTLPVLPSPRLPISTLIKIVQTISGVQVVWNTSKRPLLALRPGQEKSWVLIGMNSWREIGIDELRYVWNPTTNNNDAMLVGQRGFTMTVQCFSLDATLQAFDLAQRIAFRIRTATARQFMVPTLAIQDIQPIITHNDLTDPVSKHLVLYATVDIRMLCVVAADPNVPDGGEIIETAEVIPPVLGDQLIP
jgi:hypothetical protein